MILQDAYFGLNQIQVKLHVKSFLSTAISTIFYYLFFPTSKIVDLATFAVSLWAWLLQIIKNEQPSQLHCKVFPDLGSFQGSLYISSWAPKALKMASVQFPTDRMCTLKKSSSGAEVRVKGCHSSWEIAGHWRKMYCPGSILKPRFFNWSSKTPEVWDTT